MRQIYLRTDSRNRVSLTKVHKELAPLYRANFTNGKIILEPIYDVPNQEAWLFDPRNREIVKRLLESLQQEATIPFDANKKEMQIEKPRAKR
jgi:hypothetical protein